MNQIFVAHCGPLLSTLVRGEIKTFLLNGVGYVIPCLENLAKFDVVLEPSRRAGVFVKSGSIFFNGFTAPVLSTYSSAIKAETGASGGILFA